MKTILILTLIATSGAFAESKFQKMYNQEHSKAPKKAPAQIVKEHSIGSKKIASDQDELSADVQELIQSETNEKVITFLSEAEELMAQATDKLERKDTSGATIAIETEIIEKIADAAKQKQKSSKGKGKPQSSALMEMMKQMMGQGDKEAPPMKGDKPGASSGEGSEGDSASANEDSSGSNKGKATTRRLPKKSGSAGTKMPKEFHKALDAYNRGIEQNS